MSLLCYVYGQTTGQTDRHTDRQTDRQTDGYTDWAGRQAEHGLALNHCTGVKLRSNMGCCLVYNPMSHLSQWLTLHVALE